MVMGTPNIPDSEGVAVKIQEKINQLQRTLDRLESYEYLSAHVAKEVAWSFDSPSGSLGTFYFGGYYYFSGTNNNFSPAINFGTANAAYGAHFMIVTGAATVNQVTIRVTGTSINDSATRTAGDTEDIVIPSGTPANSFYETDKKWIGIVSIQTVGGTAIQCNYGHVKYWDNNNENFTVRGIDVTWLGGANDSGANIALLHHKATGWTYNAGANPTVPTPICAMQTDYVTEYQVKNGQNGAYKRANLDVDVAGGASEGTIIRITTTANRAFEIGNFILRYANQ